MSSTGDKFKTLEESIQQHGGRLWVESKPGEGAAFFIALPVQSPI
jgi:signal transduction histidine kinase